MSVPELRFYEAIVMNGAPDPELPGHLSVMIPGLYGANEVPVLVPPLYPGCHAGGWQSNPTEVNPDDPDGGLEGNPPRVTVVQFGYESFFWIGTSQAWDFISAKPGKRAGARSGDGRHSVYIDDELGVYITAGSDSEEETRNFIGVGTDDTVQMRNATGGMASISTNQALLMSPGGDVLCMDDNGVLLLHRGGLAGLSLRNGDLAALNAKAAQINAGTIELGGGSAPPIHPYMLTLEFLADMLTVLTDVIAIGAAIPTLTAYVATNATTMASKIGTSLSTGAPYLSKRIKGD
jgi:hypothetical protein